MQTLKRLTLQYSSFFIVTLCFLAGYGLLWLGEINRLFPVLGMLLLAIWIPGWIYWALLHPSSPWTEKLVLGSAFGYALFVIVALWLSYLPGGLDRWTFLGAFHLISLIGGFIWLYRKFSLRSSPSIQHLPMLPPPAVWLTNRGMIVAYVILLVVTIYLRTANLSYSEFQGDEAKMVMQAIGVLHGQEEVLFLHRKGPAEVLLPVAIFAFAGSLTEFTARLPFFFLHLLFIALVALLGRRIGGNRVGWLAAMLLAIDGMHVGLGRIVQYTGFIYLMSVATVYVLVHINQQLEQPSARSTRAISGALLSASIFTTAGLLAHYEAAAVVAPGTYLLWRLYRTINVGKLFFRSLVWPFIIAVVILGSFYGPFLTHPQIGDTAEHFNSAVLGLGETLYHNNLENFWQRSVLYTAAPLIVFALTLLVWALVLCYWCSKSRIHRGVAVSLVLAAVLLAYHPQPRIVQNIDLSLFLHLWFIGGVLVAPHTSPYQRMLWLWFIPIWTLAVLVFKDPGLHYYAFYTPWMLLVALTFEDLRQIAAARIGKVIGNSLAMLSVAIVLATGIYYAQRVFVEHTPELVRNWRQLASSTLPSWLALTDPESSPKMGFPHKSGWKTIGVLYESQVLRGSYASNMRQWITDWYTRGAEYCEDMPDYVLIERGEREQNQTKLFAMMGDAYALWGIVHVAGEPRLDIYKRGPAEGPPQQFDNEEYEWRFDAHHSGPIAGYVVPSVTSIFQPVSFRFGESIELTGIYLGSTSSTPGGYIDLSLRYRVLQQPQKDYTLFLQIIGENHRMIGQRDRSPTCDGKPTSTWKIGTEKIGNYRIPVFVDSPMGQYPLWIGMYDGSTGERLLIYDSSGSLLGDAISIGDVTLSSSLSSEQ